MKRDSLAHEFVETIPSHLDEGTLYVSVPYRTAVHLCACGCGNRVVTPLRPSRWQLYFDGESVSLSPSVGSWQFPCRSHYWIEKDCIRWARQWTDKEIATGRERDAQDVRGYYEGRRARAMQPVATPQPTIGLFRRAWRRFRQRVG